MLRGLKVSCLLIANVTPFVNISNIFKLKVSCLLIANVTPFGNISNIFKQLNIYVMTFRVAHWNTLDDSLAF